MLARRQFITRSGSLLLVSATGLRSVRAAAAPAKLSLWILRGGLDGLSAVPPWGDPDYARVRRQLALGSPGQTDGVIDLDGQFGLHPALQHLGTLYARGDLLPVHAVATPYRDRSHFDAQKVLENGTTGPGTVSGWLNRWLALHTERSALAVGGQIPLVVRGDRSVASWSPSVLPGGDDDTLERVAALYASYPDFAQRFDQALGASALQDDNGMMAGPRGGRQRGAGFAQLAAAAGRFMRERDGPDVTVLESGGWDTHANQGGANGQLANRLGQLDNGIAQFERELGAAWSRTIVVVMTEFGRTAEPNGTNGTDHGTASVALLAGGAVNGGCVLADWPGLARRDLHEARDLRPTTDLRSLLKGVLAGHFGTTEAGLQEAVFPDSHAIAPISDLVRPT